MIAPNTARACLSALLALACLAIVAFVADDRSIFVLHSTMSIKETPVDVGTIKESPTSFLEAGMDAVRKPVDSSTPAFKKFNGWFAKVVGSGQKAGWLKKNDPIGQVIDHQDDADVKRAAKNNDVKYGVMTRRAERHDVNKVVQENNDVAAAMSKAVREEIQEVKKEKHDQATTKMLIKEIYNETFHKKMQKERQAKKLRKIRLARKKRLAAFKKAKRIEVQFKKGCKQLAKIMEKANPKQRRVYQLASKC